jgi:glutaredoxin/peroxiredoxin
MISDQPDRGLDGSGVLVYGSRTCEDTAITRSRLVALNVPFREIDIDADADALARVIEFEGRRVTPTVVIGDGEAVVAEPTIERLEELLRSAGHQIEAPIARQIHGSVADRPIPLTTLSSALGGRFSFEELRGRLQAGIFFAHGTSCLACQGYARQLVGQADAMREADGIPIIVVPDEAEAARAWAAEVPAEALILADPGGAWIDAVKAIVGGVPDGVMLLVVDRYVAPRAVSIAAEAGGLIAPLEATDWLRFLALECPECGGEVDWPG